MDDGELIAKGGFGVVYKWLEPSTSTHVAVKFIPIKDIYRNMLEILLMYYTDVEYIQKCKSVGIVDNSLIIVQELALCDMSKVFREFPDESINGRAPLMINILYDTIIGLNYLHCSNIIHGDIKTNNILIYRSDQGRLYGKLADFGHSRIYNTGENDISVSIYRAPEVYDNNTNQKSDVWSLAIAFMLMLKYIKFTSIIKDQCRDLDMCNISLILDITDPNHNFNYNSLTPNIKITSSYNRHKDSNICRLLTTMLKQDHNLRPYCSELMLNNLFVNVERVYDITTRTFDTQSLALEFNKYVINNTETTVKNYEQVLFKTFKLHSRDRDKMDNICISYLKHRGVISF